MDKMYQDLKKSINEIEQSNSNVANNSSVYHPSSSSYNQPRNNISQPQNKPLQNVQHTFEVKSTLSPHAPVFVPRFAMNPQPIQQQSQVVSNFEQASSYYEHNYEVANDSDTETGDFVALSDLKFFIDTISRNPADYESFIDCITNVLKKTIAEDPEIILECIVNTIVDQAIMDTNFIYNGVRLCLHLIQNLDVVTLKGNFKSILLQRCQREHLRRASLAIASDKGLYLRGLTFFIADLCIKLREDDLFLAVVNLLETLVNHENSENIKCCCQVLKLSGKSLAEFLRTKYPDKSLSSIIEKLKSFLDREGFESYIYTLIKSAVDLYNNNWVQVNTQPAVQYNQYNFPENGCEHFGYDFGPCGDESNNDVCDAFEEFLRNSGQMN